MQYIHTADVYRVTVLIAGIYTCGGLTRRLLLSVFEVCSVDSEMYFLEPT